MATYQILGPQPMAIKRDIVKNWQEFKDAVMGPDCKRVLINSPGITAEDRQDPKLILKALRNYFLTQKSPI